jgi:MFS family permease
MASAYGDLLRTRHAARLLGGTLAGRLPNATVGLVVLLFVRAHGGSYTLAGMLTAVYGLGTAVGQPALGRLVDRDGQTRVMLGGALVYAAATCTLALTGPRPVPLAVALIALAGLATPPLEGGLRALWPSVLAVPGAGADPAAARTAADRLHAAYALDAAAQEVMYVAGPLLVTLTVAALSSAAALAVLAGVGIAGALTVVTAPPSRRWRAAPRHPDWLGPLRSGGIAVLLGSYFFVGAALGAITVGAVAATGSGPASGYPLAALGGGALIGALVHGSRPATAAPERRLRLLMAGLALFYWPLALASGPVAVTVLSGLAGVFLAPSLAVAFVVVDRHAPAGTVTEAFSWLATAFGVGAAAGSALAGPAAQYGGATGGFLVAGCTGSAALAVLLAGARTLTAAPTGWTGAENDRSGAPGNGFSTTHQA